MAALLPGVAPEMGKVWLLAAGALVFAGSSAQAEEKEEPLLLLVPLGDPSEDLVKQTALSIRARFRFRVEIAEPMAMPEDAWHAPRKRWRAEKILDALDLIE